MLYDRSQAGSARMTCALPRHNGKPELVLVSTEMHPLGGPEQMRRRLWVVLSLANREGFAAAVQRQVRRERYNGVSFPAGFWPQRRSAKWGSS